MNKFTIYNYYDELTEKQREKLQDRRGMMLYHDYIEECEQRLSYEEAGVMMLAILHYSRHHGTKEIPQELADEINKNPLMCYMFETWQKREATACKNWINKKGTPKAKTKPKTTIMVSGDEVELIGDEDNFPKSISDFPAKYQPYFDMIIYHGNDAKWNKPYLQIAEELIESYGLDDELPF